MTDNTAKHKPTPRAILIALAILTGLGCGVTVYMTLRAIAADEARHVTQLEADARNAARGIEDYLGERQRLVRVFVQEHLDLVNRFEENPESQALRQEIANLLRQQFPSYFTFTIAGPNGRDLVNDIEGLVGEVCLLDIEEYVHQLSDAEHGEAHYRTVIHPQAGHYHFDVMTPRSDGDQLKGVFFVSFFPGPLAGILRANQSPGHSLSVVNTDQPDLLEFGTEGARDKISLRRDIRLDTIEMNNVVARADIAHSRWRVIGSIKPDFLAQERSDRRVVAIMIMIAIVCGSTAAAFWVTRKR